MARRRGSKAVGSLGGGPILHRNLTNDSLLWCTQLSPALTASSPCPLPLLSVATEQDLGPGSSSTFLPPFNLSFLLSFWLAFYFSSLFFLFPSNFSSFPLTQYQSTPMDVVSPSPTPLLALWGLSSFPASIHSFYFMSWAQRKTNLDLSDAFFFIATLVIPVFVKQFSLILFTCSIIHRIYMHNKIFCLDFHSPHIYQP